MDGRLTNVWHDVWTNTPYSRKLNLCMLVLNIRRLCEIYGSNIVNIVMLILFVVGLFRRMLKRF